MILQMAYRPFRLLGCGATHSRSISLLISKRTYLPCTNWSIIFQSVLTKPKENVCDVKSPCCGIRSLHVRSRYGISNNLIWPYCHPDLQTSPFFSSRRRSEVCNRELNTNNQNKNEVTVDCQKGQEILKNFLMLAESQGMQVSPGEIIQVIDDLIVGVYSNGKYPFMAQYDLFQDQSSTGRVGTAGERGVFQLFREQALLKDFATCPEIESMLSLINENMSALTASEKAHLFFCLNYLGVHKEHTNHPVMHKLFYVLTEPAGKLNFQDICKFKLVLETLSNLKLVKHQLLQPHYRYLDSVGFLTGIDKQQFIEAISHSGKLFVKAIPSNTIPKNFSSILLALVKDEDIMKCPENIIILLNYLGGTYHIPHILKNDIHGRLEGAILQQLDNLDIKTLGKLSNTHGFREWYHTCGKLKPALLDRIQEILHSTSDMDTVEMLSVMSFFRTVDFQLPRDSLAILVHHIEKIFPELKLIYFISFMGFLGDLIGHHKNDNPHMFDRLMTLLNTNLEADMFQRPNYQKLVLKWRMSGLTDEAFKMFIQHNVLSKKGFGKNKRWLPLVMQVMDKRLEDEDLKRDLNDRIFSICEKETNLYNLLCISIAIHGEFVNSEIHHEHAKFYKEIQRLFKSKLAAATDLKQVVPCFSNYRNIRRYHSFSVPMMESIDYLMERTSELIILPHQRKDAVKLGQAISHHFYRPSKDFFQITTPAVDQLVTNLLKKEQTCDIDDFVALTNLVASGVMSKSKQQELELCADRILEENMDFMNLDSLLLSLDNLCLAGVFPPKTLSTVMSTDFLSTIDQCTYEMSHRVVSRENIEYHILRLNRSVVLECPELDIPWFCGELDVHKMPQKRYLHMLVTMTRDALLEILGGEKFLSMHSTTRFKHAVDLQCFISPQGTPIAVDKINMNVPIPAAITKIAIDVIPNNLWSEQPDVMYQEKKRQLKKEGYKYIQMTKDHLTGLALSGMPQLCDYYYKEIFRELGLPRVSGCQNNYPPR